VQQVLQQLIKEIIFKNDFLLGAWIGTIGRQYLELTSLTWLTLYLSPGAVGSNQLLDD